MRRTIALTIAGLFLGAVALGADHQRKPEKHQDSTRPIVSGDHSGDSAVAGSVSWGTRDIEMIRRHYARRIAIYRLVCRRNTHARDSCRPGGRKRLSHSLRHSSANVHRCRPGIAAASSTRML